MTEEIKEVAERASATPPIAPTVYDSVRDRTYVQELQHIVDNRTRGCPCLHTPPCHERCACVMPVSSSGCWRCCSYKSPEQQQAMARRLAAAIGFRLAELHDLDECLRESGFVRIGRVDNDIRRSLWLKEDRPIEGRPADAFELRAGREGDDAYVRVTRDNPQFTELSDVMSRARYAAEWEEPRGFALDHADLHAQVQTLLSRNILLEEGLRESLDAHDRGCDSPYARCVAPISCDRVDELRKLLPAPASTPPIPEKTT